MSTLSNAEYLRRLKQGGVGYNTNSSNFDAYLNNQMLQNSDYRDYLQQSLTNANNQPKLYSKDTQETLDKANKVLEESKSFLNDRERLNFNLTKGIFNFFEGIGDFVIGLSGGIGKVFGADDQWAQDAIKYDWSSKAALLFEHLDPLTWSWDGGKTGFNAFDASEWDLSDEGVERALDRYKNQGVMKDVLPEWLVDGADELVATVGQMLPSIALGDYVGAAGQVAGWVQKAVSVGSMALSAAGNATSEALQETDDLGKAIGYGIASGTVEGVSEYVFSWATKGAGAAMEKVGLDGSKLANLLPNSVSGWFGKEVSKNFAVQLGKEFVEEGAEEVFSDLMNPLIKSIYNGKSVSENYEELDPQELVHSFVMGGMTTLVLGGANIASDVSLGKNGREAKGYISDAMDSYYEIQDMAKKNQIYTLDSNGNEVMSQKAKSLLDNIANTQLKLSEIYDKMSTSEKAKFFKSVTGKNLNHNYKTELKAVDNSIQEIKQNIEKANKSGANVDLSAQNNIIKALETKKEALLKGFDNYTEGIVGDYTKNIFKGINVEQIQFEADNQKLEKNLKKYFKHTNEKNFTLLKNTHNAILSDLKRINNSFTNNADRVNFLKNFYSFANEVDSNLSTNKAKELYQELVRSYGLNVEEFTTKLTINEVLKKIPRIDRVQVEFARANTFDDGVSAEYNNKTKTIRINSELVDKYPALFAHEYLGHVLGNNFTETQINNAFQKIGMTEWYKNNKLKLEKAYGNLDALGYKNEVISKYIENAFSSGNSFTRNLKILRDSLLDKAFLDRLIKYSNSDFARNIFKNDVAMKTLIDDLNSFAKNKKDNFMEYAEAISKIAKYEKNGNSEEYNKYFGNVENKDEFFEVNLSLSNEKNEEILDVFHKQFIVGKKIILTGLPLENLSVFAETEDPSPFYVESEKIYEITASKGDAHARHPHEMTSVEIINSLKNIISNPCVVIEQKSHKYLRYLFIGNQVDKDGYIINIAIEPNKNINVIDQVEKKKVTKGAYLVTLFGRDNLFSVKKGKIDYFLAEIERMQKKEDRKGKEFNILYYNKKKVPRQQSPLGPSSYDSIIATIDELDNIEDIRGRWIFDEDGFRMSDEEVKKAIENRKNIDNQFKEGENNNYERNDDFRRIQEESRRTPSEEVQLYHSKGKEIDSSLRRRLSTIFKRQLESIDSGISNDSRLLKDTGDFKVIKNVDGELFHDIFEIVHNYLPYGELVDLHDNYNDSTCYLSDDGLSGFAITKDGDLISVFNLNDKRGWLRAISNEITTKAKTLDCYVSPIQNLQQMYESKFGFKTASIMDYNMEYDHDNIAKNHDNPQVAFMVNTSENVETKHFNKDEYDAAKENQLKYIKNPAKVQYSKDLDYEDNTTRNNLNDKKTLQNTIKNVDEYSKNLDGINKRTTSIYKKLLKTFNEVSSDPKALVNIIEQSKIALNSRFPNLSKELNLEILKKMNSGEIGVDVNLVKNTATNFYTILKASVQNPNLDFSSSRNYLSTALLSNNNKYNAIVDELTAYKTKVEEYEKVRIPNIINAASLLPTVEAYDGQQKVAVEKKTDFNAQKQEIEKGDSAKTIVNKAINNAKTADITRKLQVQLTNKEASYEKALIASGNFNYDKAIASSYELRRANHIVEADLKFGMRKFDNMGRPIINKNTVGKEYQERTQSLADARLKLVEYSNSLEGKKKFLDYFKKGFTPQQEDVDRLVSLYAYYDLAIDTNNKYTKDLINSFESISIQGVGVDNSELFKNTLSYLNKIKANGQSVDLKALESALDKDFNKINQNKDLSNTNKQALIDAGKKAYIDVDYKDVFGRSITKNELSKLFTTSETYKLFNFDELEERIKKLSPGNEIYYDDFVNAIKETTIGKTKETFKSLSEKGKLTADEQKAYKEIQKLIREANKYFSYPSNESLNLGKENIKKIIPTEIVDSYLGAIYDNLTQVRNQAIYNGLITVEEARAMEQAYHHYVPLGRMKVKGFNSGSINADNLTKARKGSSEVIAPLLDNVVNLIKSSEKKGIINRQLNEAYNSNNYSKNNLIEFEEDPEPAKIKNALDAEKIEDIMLFGDSSNSIKFSTIKNGERIQMTAKFSDPLVMEAFNSQGFKFPFKLNFFNKINSIFKNLVTSYNPFFIFRNASRDIQDALFTTRNGFANFSKEYFKSFKEIMRGDSFLWKVYVDNGGLASSMFAKDSTYELSDSLVNMSKDTHKSKVKKTLGIIGYLNEVVEAAPRFTEFKLSYKSYIKAGYNETTALKLAMSDAANVTTDFSRGGIFTKWAGRTLVPFLNPQVQGASKVVGLFLHPKDKKTIANLLMRLLLLGLSQAIINKLLNAFNDDYESLPEYTKEQYFLIPLGNGEYFKIPKGRITGTIQSFFQNLINACKGEEDPFEAAKTFVDTAKTNLAPVDVFSGIRTIFAPISDVRNNTTWYGQSIDKQSDLNKRPSSRYDSDTSEVSKAIGKMFNYSPKRIDYLLAQYTGVVGDVILPLTSESGFKEGVGGNLLNFVKSNTTISAVKNTQFRSDFYNLREEMLYDSNDGDQSAKYTYSYLNKVLNEIDELEEKIDTASNDAERYTIYLTIRECYKSAIKNAKALKESLDKMVLTEENSREEITEAYRQTFGAAEALKYYNKNAYSKATIGNKFGLTYDNYYQLYFLARSLNTKAEVKALVRNYVGNDTYKMCAVMKLLGVQLSDEEKAKAKSFLSKRVNKEDLELLKL